MEAETGTKICTRAFKHTTYSNKQLPNTSQNYSPGTAYLKCWHSISKYCICMTHYVHHVRVNLHWQIYEIPQSTLYVHNETEHGTSRKKKLIHQWMTEYSLKHSTTFDGACNWRSSSWWTASWPIIRNEWFKLVTWRRSDQKTVLWGHNTENGQLTQDQINKKTNLGSMGVRLCDLSCW